MGIILRLCITLVNERMKATVMMEVVDQKGDLASVNEGVICTTLTNYKIHRHQRLESASLNEYSVGWPSSFVAGCRSEGREETKKKREMRER